jgi:hypothetical protein
MAKDHLSEFETFYQEIPANDYLSGFDAPIEDLVEDDQANPGLNADQVSRLAQDTVYGEEIIRHVDDRGPSEEQELFDQED